MSALSSDALPKPWPLKQWLSTTTEQAIILDNAAHLTFVA